MIVHYLVIWILNGDMQTRKETSMDLEFEYYDTPAEQRMQIVFKYIREQYKVHFSSKINIINICRL